ncbi:acyl-CoA reductase [Sphingobacterium sp. HJSM2_6]|uniref:acyl-CoA reductase n=1 Tax=Sphingobacterium sp. HJSM2_6 TaxID=3366264 RepID=UPI003BCF931E
MTLQDRISAFVKLGDYLKSEDFAQSPFLNSVANRNAWYSKENVLQQANAIAYNLNQEALTQWLLNFPDMQSNKRVGLVLAGNIPLVGFHDILSVLICGFHAEIKVSSDDAGLTQAVLGILVSIEPQFSNYFHLVDRLQDYDLIIATGSNNSSRYFAHYFSKKPHIIRKNRNSIAILSGEESAEELRQLGHDIFDFFGLGCRSVSKIYFPQGYEISRFYEAMEQFAGVKDHFKYHNNYDFNKSIYLINKDKHFDNGFLLLKEDVTLTSPLAVLHYEYYEDLAVLLQQIDQQQQEIQCVTSSMDLNCEAAVFPFGASQYPKLADYADQVDTLAFLRKNQ